MRLGKKLRFAFYAMSSEGESTCRKSSAALESSMAALTSDVKENRGVGSKDEDFFVGFEKEAKMAAKFSAKCWLGAVFARVACASRFPQNTWPGTSFPFPLPRFSCFFFALFSTVPLSPELLSTRCSCPVS
eukprot:gb/GEZJ01005160.1/.p1 GENE.gb/GEZJ01005160.1/~~gb/GEZJ01005160.1/.p1  ORF type:complete len:131 (-),score=4.03 gb/GEZJ01005160.1/:371-763(-)